MNNSTTTTTVLVLQLLQTWYEYTDTDLALVQETLQTLQVDSLFGWCC